MFEFLNNFIHYKRKLNQDYEELWNEMLDGRAAEFDANSKDLKKSVIYLLINIVLACVAVALGANIIPYHEGILANVTNVIAWISMIGVPLACFILFRVMKKFSKKHSTLLMFGVNVVACFLLGLLLSALNWIG